MSGCRVHSKRVVTSYACPFCEVERLRRELRIPDDIIDEYKTQLEAAKKDVAELILAYQRVISEQSAGRNTRQALVLSWVRETFGEVAISRRERVLRFAEEAIELVQAENVPLLELMTLLTHVYGKPKDEPFQEVGGIGVTLLGYCAVAGLSADAEEQREFNRVLSIPVEHFRARQNKKADAGVAVRCVMGVMVEEKKDSIECACDCHANGPGPGLRKEHCEECHPALP